MTSTTNLMKNRVLLTLILSIICISSFAQNYKTLIQKADSLFSISRYEDAALTYSKAIQVTGGKTTSFDRYRTADAYALADNPDSAFHHLGILATKDSFSYYSVIAKDGNLAGLRSDKRWKPLLNALKQNRAKVIEKSKSNCHGDSKPGEDASVFPEIENYVLNVDISVKQKSLLVKGYVDIDFKGLDSVDLVLYGKTKINAIKESNKKLKYAFSTTDKLPGIFNSNCAKLTIFKNANSSDKQNIYFDYSSDMNGLSGWGSSFKEDWIEIGYYMAWFPLHPETKNARSELTITIDDPYRLNGSGIVTKNGNTWKMIHNWGIYDNAIIASKELKSKIRKVNSSLSAELVYTTFPEQETDSVLTTLVDILKFYEQLFGSPSSLQIKFVVCPTIGSGGYARRNYVVLMENKINDGMIEGMAHEFAHLWWDDASPSMWDNWLNEAFAEYCQLLYVRKVFGEQAFGLRIDAYRVNTENTCPIWGIDINNLDAYAVIYEKGALVLYDLHTKIGDDRFFSLLKEMHEQKIITTKDFLLLVESKLGLEIRNWTEMKLKF